VNDDCGKTTTDGTVTTYEIGTNTDDEISVGTLV
jgi:hypothetical protein